MKVIARWASWFFALLLMLGMGSTWFPSQHKYKGTSLSITTSATDVIRPDEVIVPRLKAADCHEFMLRVGGEVLVSGTRKPDVNSLCSGREEEHFLKLENVSLPVEVVRGSPSMLLESGTEMSVTRVQQPGTFVFGGMLVAFLIWLVLLLLIEVVIRSYFGL
jgi:hypothetical protein